MTLRRSIRLNLFETPYDANYGTGIDVAATDLCYVPRESNLCGLSSFQLLSIQIVNWKSTTEDPVPEDLHRRSSNISTEPANIGSLQTGDSQGFQHRMLRFPKS